MKKRSTAWLLLITLLISLVLPFRQMPVALADTATENIDRIANELAKIRSFFDTNDVNAMVYARTNLQGLSDDQWNTVINPMINSDLVSNCKFSDETAAKNALKNFAQGTGNVYYSVNHDELVGNLTVFESAYKSTFQQLFGTDVTADDLYNFYVETKNQLKNAVSTLDINIQDIAYSSNTALVEMMPQITRKAAQLAIQQPYLQKLSGRLVNNGWSTDILINEQKALSREVDPENKAELALAKALVRSEAELTRVEGVVAKQVYNKGIDNFRSDSIDQTYQYTLRIMGKDATGIVDWVTVDNSESIVEVNKYTGEVTPRGVGSTEIIAYRAVSYNITNNTDVGNPATDWIYRVFVNVQPTAAQIAANITTIAAVYSNQTSLVLPLVPPGFGISICSSTSPSVIAIDGNITPPTVATSVYLVLTVTNLADLGQTANTQLISVFVPAKTVPQVSAPTGPIVNDGLNTFGWTNVQGFSNVTDYEISIDNGNTWTTCSTNPQRIGNKSLLSGYVQVRIKADVLSGRSSGLVLVSNASFTQLLYGDINLSGGISAADVTYLRKALAGVTGYDIRQQGDCNRSGSVSAADVTYLRKVLAGVTGYVIDQNN